MKPSAGGACTTQTFGSEQSRRLPAGSNCAPTTRTPNMPDPIPFEIEVTVDKVRIRVTLLLRSGTVVEQVKNASADTTLRSAESGAAPDDKPG